MAFLLSLHPQDDLEVSVGFSLKCPELEYPYRPFQLAFSDSLTLSEANPGSNARHRGSPLGGHEIPPPHQPPVLRSTLNPVDLSIIRSVEKPLRSNTLCAYGLRDHGEFWF